MGKGTGEKASSRTMPERAQAVPREGEGFFRSLIENSIDATVILDGDGSIRYASPSIERVMGYKPEDRIRENAFEFVHPADRQSATDAFAQMVQNPGSALHKQIRVKHADGSWRNLEVLGKNLLDDPAVRGIVATYRDVTELRQREDAVRWSEAKYTALIEQARDGVTVVQDGVIRFANKALTEITGYSNEELTGMYFLDIVMPEYKDQTRERYETYLEGKIPSSFNELRIRRKDGEIRDVEASGRIFQYDGNPAVMGIARDVTERKQAQEALRESEERYRAFFEQAADSIVLIDVETGELVEFNDRACDNLGYSPKELRRLKIPDFEAIESAQEVAEHIQKIVEQGKDVFETKHRRKDGEIRDVLVSSRAISFRGRELIQSIWHDITARKRAEEALAALRRVSDVMEAMPDALIMLDTNGNVAQINSAYTKMFGLKPEEVVGKSIMELPTMRSEDAEKGMQLIKEVLETGKAEAIDMMVYTKGGKEFPISATGAIVKDAEGNPIYFVSTMRDITERKQMEDSLRREEEYFRALTENSLDFIAVLNSDGTVRYESPSVERVLGYKPEERIGRSGLEHIHPEDMSEATSLLVGLVGNPGTTVRVQSRFRHKDGSWRVLDVVAQNLLDNPAVAGIVANMRDVTEQKKAEQALRESEHNYRVLFESTIDGAAVIDAETMKVVLANETAAKMYGFGSMEEVVEANPVDYVHPDDRERALTTLAEDLFEKDLRRVEEFRTLTKEGRVRWIAGVGTRVEYQGRLAGLISFRDITEQKRMDEKLRELYEQERESRQQLEAEMKKRVEFTRALAHELKTPLTSVLASSDLLASELREEPLQTLAKSIRQGASNLNSRIDELLDLARGEVGMLQLRLEWVDMSKLLRETAESMIPLASRRGQSLVIALPLSLPPVRVDAARLQQIVVNLLSNALKFTPVGGNIKLGAKQKDAALVVEVRDMGRGIPKEDQEFLFEPYHRLQTEPSGGLGLGLALCRMLVELHGGQIWVRSQVGKGSTFGFSLPLETTGKQAEELEKPAKLWRVLIIEDDQNIVSTVSVAFQMHWPEAELVSTAMGEEGLHLVETANPDLVILDLGLPDVDGFDVLRRIRLLSSVPVVILTVRGDEADKVKGVELGADDYVVKPFKPQELLARLKAQLRKSISP